MASSDMEVGVVGCLFDRVRRFLPITVKTMVITQFLQIRQKYFLPRGEMAETKFWENCHENTQLIETLTG